MLTDIATNLFKTLIDLQKNTDAEDLFDKKSIIASVSGALRLIVDTLNGICDKRDTSDLNVVSDSTSSKSTPTLKGTQVAGVLSLDHFRAVYTGIELLWSTSLLPYVTSSLLFYQEVNLTYPKTLVVSESTMSRVTAGTPSMTSLSDLWNVFCLIFDISFCPSFSHTMQKRFLKRLLIFKLLISHSDRGMFSYMECTSSFRFLLICFLCFIRHGHEECFDASKRFREFC